MKIQIDTEKKTIKIDEPTQLSDFFDFIQKVLPGEWKEYTLSVEHIVKWSQPIVIEKPYVIEKNPCNPPYQPYPYIWCQNEYTTTGTGTLPKMQTINFEVR